jgi:Protein of unknown function DUF262
MDTVKELTAAESGLGVERQIQIALQAMVDHGGSATMQQLYDALERNMALGVRLSQRGRDTLRSLVNRDAVEKGYAEKGSRGQSGWRITPAGRDYVEQVQSELGTEAEEALADEPDEPAVVPENLTIARPFDPSSIRVEQRMMTIFQVMRKIEKNDIDLRPDFQRNFVWSPVRRSRLIESILLKIPLPAFYLDATPNDRWIVVDGLQRLSTLDNFYNKKLDPLANLEFLVDLEGKGFDQLPRGMQRDIEDTQLNLYIIRPETSPQVKFTIFSRVNTGGLVLTPQEIRHALFQGRATVYLAELSELPEFVVATSGSINPLRMDDRECVLRFLAFHLTYYSQYGKAERREKSGRLVPQSFDGFLSEAMERLNAMSTAGGEVELASLRETFRDAMKKAAAVFGNYAFRKMYQKGGRRSQISKPLFEVWSVMLVPYDLEALREHRDAIIDKFIQLMNDVEFNKAISLGTGSVRGVHARFFAIEKLLKETVK